VSEGESIPAESKRRIERLVADHAAGILSEPFAVLVAAYLQLRDDRRGAAPPPQAVVSMEQMNALMPLALRHYVGRHLGNVLHWRMILPGLKQCLIARDEHAEARFLRCRAGRAIPSHTHVGREAALVLQGGFDDATGHYGRGDIEVADATIDHRPVADDSGECIIFLALEAPVRLTGPFGRLLHRFTSYYALDAFSD
jgi:putative transcriptional regulator